MTASDRLIAVLNRSWWIVFPAFAVLAVRLSVDRSCGDPAHLLPELTSNPLWAWPLALLYLIAHLWACAAYALTAARTGSLVPTRAAWRELWGSRLTQIVLLVLVLIIEHAPAPVWRLAGRAFCSGA
jgi:hypothetical protein